jgi:5'-methylthioadenosine phosphorylase
MSETIRLGIMAGTGVYELPNIEDLKQAIVSTPYGDVNVNIGVLYGKKVAFITRHGSNHSISPGYINFRANIYAFKELGVRQIIATACSGSTNPEYGKGSFTLIKQFIEFTKNRPSSFCYNDGSEDKRIYAVDVTWPYCSRVGEYIKRAGEAIGIKVMDNATYACFEGPRFESYGEIKMVQKLGGDLVGHTQYPEMVLAREAQICYAAIGIVANMAAGIAEAHVSSKDVRANMKKVFEDVQKLLAETIKLLPEEEDCWCQHSLDLCP